jgi:hypothetical protein
LQQLVDMGRFRSSSLPDLDFRAAEHHDGLIRYQIEAVIAAAREELHPRVGLPRIGLEIEREFAERRADLLLRRRDEKAARKFFASC